MTQDERLEKIRHLRKAGITLKTIGRSLGITRSRVSQICHQYDIRGSNNAPLRRISRRVFDERKAEEITAAKREYWRCA